MKKSWNAPSLELLDISSTQYNQTKTIDKDAYIYDADTKVEVQVLGYLSGSATE
jgi:hypothetical protein